MGVSGKWIDFAILIIVMAAGVTFMAPLLVEFSKPIASYTEDKTALDTRDAIYVDAVERTGNDLLLSLYLMDETVPFPKSIQINDTPVIDINKQWLAQKDNNVRDIYNETGDYKLKTMLDWVIEKVEYVHNGGDPYLKYTLKEN